MVKRLIQGVMVSTMILLSGAQLVRAEVKTEMETLMIEQRQSTDVVNIRTLGKEAYQFAFSISDTERLRTAYLSGNEVLGEFEEQSAFARIDGVILALQSEQTKEGIKLPQWTDGVLIESGDVFVPVAFVQQQFDLSLRNNGLVYEKEVIVEPEVVAELAPIEDKVVETDVPIEEVVIEESVEPIETPVVKEEPKKEAVIEDVIEEKEEPVQEEPVSEEEELPKDKPIKEPEVDEAELERWAVFEKASLELHPDIKAILSDTTLELIVEKEQNEPEKLTTLITDWLKANPFVYEVVEQETSTHYHIKRPLM